MADINPHTTGGCFSPYMVISSALQFVFCKEKRDEQDRSNRSNIEFQEWMTERKNDFEDDLNELKLKWMKEKLQFQKTARAEQKYASKELSYKTDEIKLFFQKYLPIDTKCLPIINEIAKQYKKDGYTPNCPINVILLHCLQDKLDYSSINNLIDNSQQAIGNFSLQRWCCKDASHNSAILNLHAIMENIPTLVISPVYIESSNKLLFNVAMWEAQADTKPLIRPTFSIECDSKLLKTPEEKDKMQKKIGYISTALTGCARDIYMLYSYGMPPTFPEFLLDKNNKAMLEFLKAEECTDIRQFILNEYRATSNILLKMNSSDQDVVKLLAQMSDTALISLSRTMNTKMISKK